MITYDFKGSAESTLNSLLALLYDPHTEYPLAIVPWDGYALKFFIRDDLEAYTEGWAKNTPVGAKA